MTFLGASGRNCAVRLACERDLPQLLRAGSTGSYWHEAGFSKADEYKRLVETGTKQQCLNGAIGPSWLWAIDLQGAANSGMAYFVDMGQGAGEGLAGIFDQHLRGSVASSEAICLVLEVVFSKLRFRRVTATVRPDNVVATRLWMALGFRAEGTRIDHRRGRAGEPQSVILLGVLQTEFRESALARRFVGGRQPT